MVENMQKCNLGNNLQKCTSQPTRDDLETVAKCGSRSTTFYCYNTV